MYVLSKNHEIGPEDRNRRMLVLDPRVGEQRNHRRWVLERYATRLTTPASKQTNPS